MSTADISTPVVIMRDGLLTVTDMNLDHDRLYESAAEWNHRQSEADEDFEARRVTRFEGSYKRALSAADDFRNAAGLTLTVDMARVLRDQLNDAIHAAEVTESLRASDTFYRNNPREAATS